MLYEIQRFLNASPSAFARPLSIAKCLEIGMTVGLEIETSFIRTLSVNGLVLGGGLSKEDRRDRIRVAIFQQRLAVEKFSDHLTFAQAYEKCYQRPLELRLHSARGGQTIDV